MERIVTTLIRSIAYSIGGLISGSLIMAVLLGIISKIQRTMTLSNVETGYSLGMFMSFFAILFGFIPTLVYGAPVYALSRLYGRASFPLSALIGIAPGIILFSLGKDPRGVVLMFGLAVGLLTHAIAQATERK